MGLNANNAGGGKKENKNFVKQPSLDPGVYPARLVQVIDLGLQAQRPFKGEEKAPVQEVMFTYELVDAFMVDEEGKDIEDKPRWISETLPFYGLYADKAKSTQRIKAFDPDDVHGGNVGEMVDTPVNVTIVHGKNLKDPERPYENVANAAAMRARDAAKCAELKNPTKVFDLDAPDLDTFNKLPEWIREKIKGNLRFKGSKLERLLEGKVDEVVNSQPAPEAGDEDPPFDVDDQPPY